MKQRIILKETDLYNIIKETINCILKEEYSSNSNEGLTFYLQESLNLLQEKMVQLDIR